jgi:hypothetical protein
MLLSSIVVYRFQNSKLTSHCNLNPSAALSLSIHQLNISFLPQYLNVNPFTLPPSSERISHLTTS